VPPADLVFDAARDQRVFDLQIADGMNGVSATKRLRADLRQSDVTHVASLYHVGDRTHGIFDRYARIEVAQAIDVDVVDSQPPQRIQPGSSSRLSGARRSPTSRRGVAQRAET